MPRTRGSTTNCWRRIAAIARDTPSMSALTKLRVTGAPRKRGCGAVAVGSAAVRRAGVCAGKGSDDSVSVAANSIRQEAALPQTGFRGGLSEDVNAGVFYAGSSADGTGGAKDFTGTISQGALWNVVGTIQVPEPTSIALLTAGVAASALRRRRRA